jgi:hypothetical protein
MNFIIKNNQLRLIKQTRRLEELTPNKANESTTAFDGFPRTAITQRTQSL